MNTQNIIPGQPQTAMPQLGNMGGNQLLESISNLSSKIKKSQSQVNIINNQEDEAENYKPAATAAQDKK